MTFASIFKIYQVAASFVLLPVSWWLWSREDGCGYGLSAAIVLLPVIFGYVVPGIGTNITRLWEFKAGIRLGRYTLLHGLMFGGASSFLAWLCRAQLTAGHGFEAMVKAVMIPAALIGVCNWVFDYFAIRKGIAVIYNKPYFLGKGPFFIILDYAPVYFGTFGGCYGAAINQMTVYSHDGDGARFWVFSAVSLLLTMILPVVAHGVSSYARHGYNGLFPYRTGI